MANPSPYVEAVEGCNISAIKDLMEKKVPCYVDLRTVAAGKGKIPILEWLKQRGHKFTSLQLEMAISNGQRETIRWLLEQQCPYDEVTLGVAVDKNDIVTAGILLRGNPELSFDREMVSQAALRGHVEMLLVMSMEGADEYIYSCAEYAAAGNQVKVLQILNAIGVKITTSDMVSAAETGSMDVLKWLHFEYGLEMDDIIYRAAVNAEQEEVISWLKEIGYVPVELESF